MQRLRFLDTLGVACALICASIVLVVQNGYACSWHAELFDYTTQETSHFSMDETPVMFLTSSAFVNDVGRAIRSSARDYIVKPDTFEELEAKLDVAIRRVGPF